MMQNWTGINFSVQNSIASLTNFDQGTRNLKKFTLMGCFWPKCIMFDLKKYRGVMFDGTEDWCKIWREMNVFFQKWHEKFGKFSTNHSKVSKLRLWWDPFIQIRKFVSLNFQEMYELWQYRMMQTLKRNGLVSSKLTWRIWQMLT